MNQEHSYKSKRRKAREDRSPVHSSGSDSDVVGRNRSRKRQPETLVFTSDGTSSSSHKKASGSSRDSHSSSRRTRTSSSKALPSATSVTTVCATPCERSSQPELVKKYEPHPLSPEPQWLDHPSPSPPLSFTDSHLRPAHSHPSYPLYIHAPQPPPVPLSPPVPISASPHPGFHSSSAQPCPIYPQPPSTPAPRQQHRRYGGGRAWDGNISVLTPGSRRGRRRPRRPHIEGDEDFSSEQDVSNA